MRDYTGKIIYLGMDVHKLSYSITAICEGEVIKRDKLASDPESIVKYCNRFFPNGKIISAYEAGFCGFELHRFLHKNAIQNIIVHPAAIEVQVNDRVKTDKRDSLRIATQLSQGRLQGIYVPSPIEESLRSVSRLRASLIKQRTRHVNRIKGYLHFLGIKVQFTRISKKTLAELRQLELLKYNKFCFHIMLNNLERVNEDIQLCEGKLKLQSDEDELEPYYLSVPGIGVTIARVLSNELGDMSQFSSEKKLFSYCGLTPSEYSSGEKVYRGCITRQGKSMLRMYLNQAASRAIRKDEGLEEAFRRIANRAGAKKAIQAVARKLIGRIRACLLKREAYKIREK